MREYKKTKKSEFDHWQKGLKIKFEKYFKDFFEVKHQKEHLEKFKDMAQKAEDRIIFLNTLESVAVEHQVDISGIARSVKMAEDIKKSAEDEINKVEKMQKFDFGIDLQFFSMYQQELRAKIGKYEYSILFYEKATQKADGKNYSLG